MRNKQELEELIQILMNSEIKDRVKIMQLANLNFEEQTFVINELMEVVAQLYVALNNK